MDYQQIYRYNAYSSIWFDMCVTLVCAGLFWIVVSCIFGVLGQTQRFARYKKIFLPMLVCTPFIAPLLSVVGLLLGGILIMYANIYMDDIDPSAVLLFHYSNSVTSKAKGKSMQAHTTIYFKDNDGKIYTINESNNLSVYTFTGTQGCVFDIHKGWLGSLWFEPTKVQCYPASQ